MERVYSYFDAHPGTERCYLFFKLYWKALFSVLWPLLMLLVFLHDVGVQQRCLYVFGVMYGLWVSECLPESATAFIPVFTFPMLHIQDSSTTCRLYYMYGLYAFTALANGVNVDHSRLHERILYYAVHLIGDSPRKVHFVIMFMSTFFSMWMANAWVVQLMLPLVTKILLQMDMSGLGRMYLSRMSVVRFDDAERKERPTNLTIAFYFGVVYSSCSGGLVYISGTGINLVYKGLYEMRFPNCSIFSGDWFLFTVVPMALVSIFGCLWLQIKYLGLFSTRRAKGRSEYEFVSTIFKVERIMENLYISLGPITWHESLVGTCYILVLGFFFFQKLFHLQGWQSALVSKYLDISSPLLIISFLMALLPAQMTFLYSCNPDRNKRPKTSGPSILPWQILQKNLPWGRLMLIGSCCCLGRALFVTGLAKTIASKFLFLKGLSYWEILAITTFATFVITELTSNIVACGVLTPIMIELAVALNIHPILISMPVAINCGFGMILPNHAHIQKTINLVNVRFTDLLIAGLPTKIFSWLIVLALYPTYGNLFFNEDIIKPKNYVNATTCYCPPCSSLSFGIMESV